MPRNNEKKSAFQRATSAVKRLFSRGRSDLEREETPSISETPQAQPQRAHRKSSSHPARPVQREADIGLDVLSRSYTPPVTSSKAGFRSNGADHQRDQEFALGSSDERWNDEDHYTNKSGDPRIGTHRRSYEPEEARE
jgi:hypothetical protein